MTGLSVQLYSVRDGLDDDTPGTLARLYELGFRAVEPYDILGDPALLARRLQDAGLSAPTAHASFLRFSLDEVLDAAERIGTATVILPSAPREAFVSRAGVRELADVVNSAAAVAARRGIGIGYHNHEFEFLARIGGVPAWEVFAGELDERVALELDLHWASVGGVDVFDLTRRFAGRIRFLHVNDEELGVEDGFASNPHDGDSSDVVTAMGDAVELVVLEVVEDGDVFPSLERNAQVFQEVAR
ncbi:sugar phosphate isomerase/epimerase family protein [Microbacterium sp. NPDC058389]|uniref:sugar phosphate isomerase/epimerase family protein n=1 Tax=Microbacterium sp. NPDC058389 TaxID=3346475 RepID=UPI00364E6801